MKLWPQIGELTVQITSIASGTKIPNKKELGELGVGIFKFILSTKSPTCDVFLAQSDWSRLRGRSLNF